MARPSILYMTSCTDALSFYIIGRETGKKSGFCAVRNCAKKSKKTLAFGICLLYTIPVALKGARFLAGKCDRLPEEMLSG